MWGLILGLAIGALCTRLVALMLEARFAKRLFSAAGAPQSIGPTSATGATSVAVVVPCKGVDLGFEENIRAILRQDYPNFRVVFVTAGKDDSAFPVLTELVEDRASHAAGLTSASLVVATPSGLVERGASICRARVGSLCPTITGFLHYPILCIGTAIWEVRPSCATFPLNDSRRGR